MVSDNEGRSEKAASSRGPMVSIFLQLLTLFISSHVCLHLSRSGVMMVVAYIIIAAAFWLQLQPPDLE